MWVGKMDDGLADARAERMELPGAASSGKKSAVLWDDELAGRRVEKMVAMKVGVKDSSWDDLKVH